jgi:hypothetical protein
MSDVGETYIHVVGWEKPNGWTYLIQQIPDGPIKIGWSRTNGLRRLAELQAANPNELRIVCIIEGREREAELHERFADRRIRGEWFSPSILDEIDDSDWDMPL